MTIRMGYWDCHACGHKRIEGPNETCTHCGQPRGSAVTFYTDDAAATVEDPELVRRARMGADWRCKYCGADNRAGHVECHQCGAGPDGTKRREERFIPAAAPAAAKAAAKSSGCIIALSVALGALVAVAVGVYFLFLRTTELTVTVDEAKWVKTLVVEEKKVERDEAWSDEVPTGAKVLKREKKGRDKTVQDGTTKVKVGTKDLGNGMFEDVFEERPNMVTKKVEDTWVTYEAIRWVQSKTLKEEGKGGEEPEAPRLPKQAGVREGARENKIVLTLAGSDGKRYEHEIDVSDDAGAAHRFEEGGSYVAEVNAMGSVTGLR